jgi:hypothetical protein
MGSEESGDKSIENASRIEDQNEEPNKDQKGSESSTLLQSPSINIDSEKYFVPFELACQGDSPRVTAAALDGLQVVISNSKKAKKFSEARIKLNA